MAPNEPGYGAYLNALHLGEATLTFPQTLVLRYGALEPPERRLPQVVADYKRWTLARLRGFATMMADADYAAAGRFTIADVSVGYALMVTRMIGFFGEIAPSLQSYYAQLEARPAFQRAKAAQQDAPPTGLEAGPP